VTIEEMVRTLRRAWWLTALGLLCGAGLSLAVAVLQTPLYSSHTQLFVSTNASGSASESINGSYFSQDRVASYTELLSGQELAGRVVRELDLELSPSEVSSRISARELASTVLIDVTVTDTSPERAQAIAEAVGREFPKLVDELETPAPTVGSLVKVTVTDPAGLPDAPTSPDLPKIVALGTVVGALLGAAVALLRARLDRSVKDPEEIAALVGAPVMGTVLRDAALDKRHTIDRLRDSRTAEDYRQLRNNLRFLNVDDPPRVIMVSSAVPSEGKTTTVINLALALADAGHRVVVVEADLRRPKVISYLGLVGGVGLTNVLAGTADLDDVLQIYGDDLVSVLAGGPTPPNPGELLASSHMRALLEKMRGQYEYVLIDAPPLLPVADASGLSAHIDGVLLSVRYGVTHKEQLREAAATVERVGGRTLGVVLNIVPPKAGSAVAYGYGYAYESAVAETRGRAGRRNRKRVDKLDH
jgi:capsular exopolysaccharide synthesis family protein